jgi:hypothetical protein
MERGGNCGCCWSHPPGPRGRSHGLPGHPTGAEVRLPGYASRGYAKSTTRSGAHGGSGRCSSSWTRNSRAGNRRQSVRSADCTPSGTGGFPRALRPASCCGRPVVGRCTEQGLTSARAAGRDLQYLAQGRITARMARDVGPRLTGRQRVVRTGLSGSSAANPLMEAHCEVGASQEYS